MNTDLPFSQSSVAVDLENGDGDNLSAADSTSLSITGNLTLEGWFKFETLPSGLNRMYLLTKFGAAGQRSFRFNLLDNSGTNQLEITLSSDGTATTIKTVNWAASTATWYHLAMVYTAAAGTVDFYVNGSLQGAQQTGLPTSIFDSTALFHIGTVVSLPVGEFMDGVVDDVRVWNTARTSSQISTNRSIELTGGETGLVAYWPFESALGEGGAFLFFM